MLIYVKYDNVRRPAFGLHYSICGLLLVLQGLDSVDESFLNTVDSGY